MQSPGAALATAVASAELLLTLTVRTHCASAESVAAQAESAAAVRTKRSDRNSVFIVAGKPSGTLGRDLLPFCFGPEGPLFDVADSVTGAAFPIGGNDA